PRDSSPLSLHDALPIYHGTHNAQGPWWLSADISLTGPVSGPDTADSGQVNTIKAKFHRKSASSNCHFPGDESITVELWVANPSLDRKSTRLNSSHGSIS